MKAAKTFQLIIGVPGGAALIALLLHWTSIFELSDELIAICIRFGRAAESAAYVRIVAWVLLFGSTLWFGLKVAEAYRVLQ